MKKYDIPNQELPIVSDYSAIYYLEQNPFRLMHMELLRKSTTIKDYILAQLLHLTPKTFSKYTEQECKIKKDTQEHILLMTHVFKHGADVFGSKECFTEWLQTPNPLFDYRKPLQFLDTITGIRFLEDRLVAMEYGDNI